MKFQAPRGTEDVLPDVSPQWRWLEDIFRNICHLYGYKEIRTPTFEVTELFARGLGEGTDVVAKEMYTFLDKGDRSITLKPEGTAGVIRAYLEHSLGGQGTLTKLFYITPIFRYERPAKGRLRESHQVGLELIGASSPESDAEVIEITTRFYEDLGFDKQLVKLNSLGEKSCRQRYREALSEFARPLAKDFPIDFRERWERNPLRLLDSKDPSIIEAMQDAPNILEYLEDDSKAHFESVQSSLSALGISFRVEPRLVRGLDYYTRTVFEVESAFLGAQNALCGGGRYDGLVEAFGGPPTPAVGVAMGIERALLALETMGFRSSYEDPLDLFVVCLTDSRSEFLKCVSELRRLGISVLTDLEFRSAKSQFRQADKSGARFALVLGDEELDSGSYTLKNLVTGQEQKVRDFQEVFNELQHSFPAS